MKTKQITDIAFASRIAFGAAAWVAPSATFAPFGVTTKDFYVTRLFATRDVVLGTLGVLSTGPQRRTLLTALAVADSVDVVAGLLAGKRREVSKPASALLVLGVLVVLVPEVNELREG